MVYYFKLQYRRGTRLLSAIGIYPIVGILLLGLFFIGLSKLLFFKTTYADWIYAGFGLLAVAQLGIEERTNSLYLLFKKSDYYKIRLIENVLVALPFLGYLIYESSYLLAAGLFVAALILALLNFKRVLHFTIPTPFKKWPFEFPIGFRKTIWLLLATYLLALKAIQVGNFNLGLFSLVVVLLISLSYYGMPEEKYFVWIFATDPTVFLKKKIGMALFNCGLLTLPFLLTIGLAFPEKTSLLLGVVLAGFIFLATFIVAKYSAFPEQINLPQAILFGLCFWFPPMLLLVFPIFYGQAKKRLKDLLE